MMNGKSSEQVESGLGSAPGGSGDSRALREVWVDVLCAWAQAEGGWTTRSTRPASEVTAGREQATAEVW